MLTPKALAAQLRIVPQTATALLRTLQAEGVVRGSDGWGSFRAFAVLGGGPGPWRAASFPRNAQAAGGF